MIVGATLAVVPLPAFAQRTPPEATMHALEEQANACAQRKPECWTPTPVPTSTPRPTATPVPAQAPIAPAPEPVADDPTPTPEPCWATDEIGEIRFREEDGTPISCEDWAAAQDTIAAALAAGEPAPVLSVPTATSTRPPATSVPPARPQPQPQQPQVIYVYPPTAVPPPATPTATPHVAATVAPTSTMLPTRTPMPTQTATPTRTATPVPPTSTPTAAPTARPTPQPKAEHPPFWQGWRLPWPQGPDEPPPSAESYWVAAIPSMRWLTDLESAA